MKNELDTAVWPNEIQALREETKPTYRAVSPELEEILYKPFPVLDHGFVRIVDYMGDDSAIVQAARVSYGKGTKKQTEDKALIHYLMRHRHTTPFEMCEIKFHIKLPIFVAREWVRHRTANINEYSARYSIMDREFYTPTPDVLGKQSLVNRQGRGEILNSEEAEKVLHLLKRDAAQCYDTYEDLLNEKEGGTVFKPGELGLARELARINLPVNAYTQWYWKIDLHNLFHFLSLRADPYAQHEIQVYAKTMLALVEKWVPTACAAFMEYRLKGRSISGKGLEVIKKMIAGDPVTAESIGMGTREWRELMDILERPEK